MHRYSAAVLPILDSSAGLFQRLARDAGAAPDSDTLVILCSQYAPQVQVQADEADGIPHPDPWYTQVGYLHHYIMGLYHDVLGALTNCTSAGSDGDPDAAGTVASDLSDNAGRLSSVDGYVRWYATH